MNMRALFYHVGLSLVLSLTACGGGDDTSLNPTSVVPEPMPLNYNGNTDPATVTLSNATELVANTALATDAASPATFLAAQPVDTNTETKVESTDLSGPLLAKQWSAIIDRVMVMTPVSPKQHTAQFAAAESIDETADCDSGSLRFVDIVEDDDTGSLDLTFDQCLLDGVTVDGKASLAITTNNSSNVSALIQTVRLTIVGPGFDIAESGSIKFETSVSADTLTIVLNLIFEDRLGGKTLRVDDYQAVVTFDDIDSPSNNTLTLSGRLYNSEHGYVDVTTVTPLCFSNLVIDLPDCGGEIILTGAGDSKIRLVAISDTNVEIDVDADGDDTYESMFTITWKELEDQIELTQPIP